MSDLELCASIIKHARAADEAVKERERVRNLLYGQGSNIPCYHGDSKNIQLVDQGNRPSAFHELDFLSGI